MSPGLRSASPGEALRNPLTWPSGSWVTIQSAKKAANSQNMTIAKPIMPTFESNSFP